MRFAQILQQLYYSPWLIEPSAYATIAALVERRMLGGQLAASSDDDDLFRQRRPLEINPSNGLARIHILGAIGKNLSKIEKSCGNTGTEDIHRELKAAAEQGAQGILLEMESSGGTELGVPELATAIRQSPLPKVAWTDTYCCSACYWLAAACDSIVATDSAQVGSIGVVYPFIDRSAAYERAGIIPMPVTNQEGDLKALGMTGRLTPAQREHMQQRADELFASFRGFVGAYRHVPAEAMRGQTFRGGPAMLNNLIDEVGDMDAALDLLQELARLKAALS